MVDQKQDPVLAFDFGGTKLVAAVVDAASGEIYAQARRPTPVTQGAETGLETMLQAGRDALAGVSGRLRQISAIGISFGGPVSQDRRRVLRSMHVKDWEDYDLPSRVEAAFGGPAFMDNDANAAALGEWYFGAGKGTADMVYLQVSTGIGAGLILNRQVYRGAGLAGEFGHLTVLEDGPVCSCGKHGCVESLASGWAIARDGRALLATGADSLWRELCGDRPGSLDAELVLRACRAGDPAASAIIQKAFKYLALGIANLILLVDPEVIVLGGGVARSQDVLQTSLDLDLPQYLPSMFAQRTRLVFSELNGQKTLLGAALLTKRL